LTCVVSERVFTKVIRRPSYVRAYSVLRNFGCIVLYKFGNRLEDMLPSQVTAMRARKYASPPAVRLRINRRHVTVASKLKFRGALLRGTWICCRLVVPSTRTTATQLESSRRKTAGSASEHVAHSTPPNQHEGDTDHCGSSSTTSSKRTCVGPSFHGMHRSRKESGHRHTPMRMIDELLAWSPASTDPNPGKKILKMRQQMPVALVTEGT
jgi:hypothetical protein